jgi:hypothetical protein
MIGKITFITQENALSSPHRFPLGFRHLALLPKLLQQL